MFTRKTIMALAAVASVGAFALATDDASARSFGGGRGIGMAHGSGMRISSPGFRRIGGGAHFRPILRPIAHRPILRPILHRPILRPPIYVHHHRHCWSRWGWRCRYWVPPVVTTGVVTGVATGVVAAAPTWNRCTCLTKEYTPEGAVVFKDLCTQEMAMNPPAAAQPAAYDPSQDPAAQGSLQPQVQAQPLMPQTAVPQVR